ncbi:hypothetical protein F5Y15DRAFT_374094 [Xylariaceae sp. FL0016]|nr:hypothetical protein F5Y15DRAFT_374094 [Xylariaceae sp. FL0016]
MRHSKSLLSPARALHRVFLSELARSTTSTTTRAASSLCLPSRSSPALPSPLQRRLQPFPPATRSAFPRGGHAVQVHTRPRFVTKRNEFTNNRIPYQWVRIASGASGELGPPRRIDEVLRSLDLKTWELVMKAPPPPPPPGSESGARAMPEAAICRLVNKVEARAAAQEEKKLARLKEVNHKELELNWAISAHDLEHKLKQLARFLEKGMTVEVMLARKRRGRTATSEECQSLVARIRECVDSVEGAQETKKMDGKMGSVLRMFLQGPLNKRKEKGKKERSRKDEDANDEEA